MAETIAVILAFILQLVFYIFIFIPFMIVCLAGFIILIPVSLISALCLFLSDKIKHLYRVIRMKKDMKKMEN